MAKAQKLGWYQRIDDGVARIEGAIAVVVLLSMVLVASAQALFFNIAQQNVTWAVEVIEGMAWADIFLQKGTLWLAFVGASMATHEEKHIGLDVVPKLAPAQVAAAMRRFAAFGAGIIALLLAWVFFDACAVADAAVPFEYELLSDRGPIHVCDATSAELGEASAPALLCTLRALLASVGVAVTSGGGVAQLIAPVMLVFIGLRLLASAILGAHRRAIEVHAHGTAGVSAGLGAEGASTDAPASPTASDVARDSAVPDPGAAQSEAAPSEGAPSGAAPSDASEGEREESPTKGADTKPEGKR